ncbi:unnamed protein product [Brachionus calyciflorus]|uniref:Uncharacterized protein n=1 Tax=Brachionus calyciflorus TaxID=104777 RepID=A0A813MCX5_9BILA|nr:unnamed protein product [Brachionus calyciflorus]
MFLTISLCICLKLAYCNAVSYFDLYEKLDNGSIYVPSSNFRQQYFLNLTLNETKLKCLHRCSRISRCLLAFMQELNIQNRFKCEFYSNLTNRSIENFELLKTNSKTTQLIFLRKDFSFTSENFGNSSVMGNADCRRLWIQGSQIYEYLEIWYVQFIVGFRFFKFNGELTRLGSRFDSTVNFTRIDLKNKYINKINLRDSGDRVFQMQICWINQLDFTHNCTPFLGENTGEVKQLEISNLGFDSDYKKFVLSAICTVSASRTHMVYFRLS